MRDAGLPIALLLLGIAWLLDSLHWLPDIHWVWVIGLVGAGIAIMLLDGLTKSSVVAGPLLIGAGLMAFFHQFYFLGWRFMIPIMLILAGLAMLVARSPSIPQSRRLRRQFNQRHGRTDDTGPHG